jgi:predicted aconitase with swiveling domain
VAPAGVLFGRTNPVMIQGPVLAGIPAMHRVSPDPFTVLSTGDRVRMCPGRGRVELIARRDGAAPGLVTPRDPGRRER